MNTEAVTGNELLTVPVNVDERCLQPYPVVEKRQGQTPADRSSNEGSMLSRAATAILLWVKKLIPGKRAYYQK